MLKIRYIVLVLLIFMADCGNSGKGDAIDEEAATSNDEIRLGDTSSIEDATNRGPATSEQYNFPEEELYIGNLRIVDMAGQSKETLLLQLGENYTHLHGEEGVEVTDLDAYEYSEYGIILYFGSDNVIQSIYCLSDTKINGVSRQMSVAEIQDILGKGQMAAETAFYARYPFVLFYVYNNFNIVFSLLDENGYSNEMEVYFRTM